MNILEMAKQDMKGYGEEVLKERAIPDFRDGLKPVHRRILWSCYELGLHHTGGTKKCARIVGDCLGKFHPHGDQSVYQALVGMATSNAQEPLIHGQGNYGGVEDAPAAMRYTEAKLSAYADKYLLDPNYLAVMPMVPNYDYTEKEPIYLPSKLPNIFIMGTEGIAYGCSNFMPTFSRASVVALVKKALTGSEIDGKLLLKTLKFKFTHGGVVCSSNREIRSYFESGVGRLEFTCEVSKGKKDNILVVDTLAPRIKPSKLEAQMNALKDVANVDPVKTRTNPHWFEVTIKKSADCKAVTDKIRSMATTALNFQTYVTHRHDDGSVTFKKTTPVEILEDWIAWRLEFEKKVLARLIGLEEAQINRYNWLIWACNNLKLIMQALESKNPDEFLRKKGKLSAEAVEFILSQQVRRLARLELSGLKDKLKAHTKKCKSLNMDLKSKVRLVSRVLETLEK